MITWDLHILIKFFKNPKPNHNKQKPESYRWQATRGIASVEVIHWRHQQAVWHMDRSMVLCFGRVKWSKKEEYFGRPCKVSQTDLQEEAGIFYFKLSVPICNNGTINTNPSSHRDIVKMFQTCATLKYSAMIRFIQNPRGK